jgi:hypothetical protein
MQQLKPCTEQVQGDEMFSDGDKIYVISKAKMARVGSDKPASEDELLEFFKIHADSVIDGPKHVPVVKVDGAGAAEQK